MREFFYVLAIIFHVEGGWTEIDGGTRYGITAATLRSANQLQIARERDIRRLTRQEAVAIYYRMFWLESGAHNLPYPLNLVLFDAAVHMGPQRARRVLRSVARNSAENGIKDMREIARLFVHERYQRLQASSRYQDFGAGWRRRLQVIYNHVNDDREREFHF